MSLLKTVTSFFSGVGSSIASAASVSLKQTVASYCDLQTADSEFALVTNDGSLVSVLKIEGITHLIGMTEFQQVLLALQQSFQTVMSQSGHSMQMYFEYDNEAAKQEIHDILEPASNTAERLKMSLEDLFSEREKFIASYCATEFVYLVLTTKVATLTKEQIKQGAKRRAADAKAQNQPAIKNTQNIFAAALELRDQHDSFVRMVVNDLKVQQIVVDLLDVHAAGYHIRRAVDPEFTDKAWKPVLPGDRIRVKSPIDPIESLMDIAWPPLARQLMPRDAFNLNLKYSQVGDRIYASVFIHLFPKDIQPFYRLFSRILMAKMPWRISFDIESDGMAKLGLKRALSSVLAFTSSQNKLINNSLDLLSYISLNTDDSVVKLQVSAATWAPCDNIPLLRSRVSMLAKAIEGWGSCDVSEVCGDAFAGVTSSMMGITSSSVATPSLAPLSDVLFMLPLFRPASPWKHGALLLRSPDGKPWPYQPGSSQQTTFIDLVYARPGSGKSVLSNAMNLAVCLSAGITRLPRIAVIDIGPSSSGFISLLKDALPLEKKSLVAYYRLRMNPEFSINPFDTQLGCRSPMPQERSFLVNFISLLATPITSTQTYDGVPDMAGLVVDEMYKHFSDEGNPNIYTSGMEEMVDILLQEIDFVADDQTTWWEVTDALFLAGFSHEAMLAQRHAVPVLADVTSICRLPAIEDLYGKIEAPTGEPLIHAFARMLSSAIREYPIISQATKFDLGDARVVALDLDEVARSGGDAANRQTAVMYMIARYVLARHYYLTEDNVNDMPQTYREYHRERVSEIREDPKRIVFDEFHRTANAQAVRDQVIVDMREGRKWKVQVALLSQSLDDFDDVMVEFATSVFIMDAGPEQAVQKTKKTFGLSDTAVRALKTQVHGPSAAGATFLAQFATKQGLNTQLLTATLGPIELWALNTTPDDVFVRNQLYQRIGPKNARALLASVFPGGSAVKFLEERYQKYKDLGHLMDSEGQSGVMAEVIEELVKRFHQKEY